MRAFCAPGGILLTNDLQFLQTSPIFANQNLTGDLLCSNTSSTLGDGIVMAEEINASLINMEYIELYPMADVYDGGLHNFHH